MKKNFLLALLISLIVILLLLSCKKNETIKIGFVGSLTGLDSDLGVLGRNGAELAIEELNKSGRLEGKRLELIVMDDENDKEKALEVDKLLKDKGVIAIVGHMTSEMASLSVPYVNEEGLIMISPTIAADYLSDRKDYFFRMIPSNEKQAHLIAREMSINGARNAAIIYDVKNLSFSQGLASFFKKEFEEEGGTIKMEQGFDLRTFDFNVLIDEVKKTKIEGIFIVASSDTAALICQHLYKNQIDIGIYLPSWAMNSSLIKHGGRAVEGSIVVNFFDNSYKGSDYKEFAKKYNEKYGGEPGFASQFSYEAVSIIGEAVEKLDDINSYSIKNYIENKKSFDGLQGGLNFDYYGDIERQGHIYIVDEGSFELKKQEVFE